MSLLRATACSKLNDGGLIMYIVGHVWKVSAAQRSVSGNNLLPSLISISGTRFPQDASTLHSLYHPWIIGLLTKRKDLRCAIRVTYLRLTQARGIDKRGQFFFQLPSRDLYYLEKSALEICEDIVLDSLV